MSDQPIQDSVKIDLAAETSNLGAPLYFNGFTVAFSGSDFSIILKVDNKPIQYLKASFTVAKTFSNEMGKMIERFEEITGHQVMTIDLVDAKLKKLIV